MADRQLVQRGNVLPLAEYRTPSGGREYGLAVPNMLMGLVDAYNALSYASGGQQDPNAPKGYVSQNALMRGGEGIASSATLGSFATRAPANALRAGASRNELPPILARGFERPKRDLDFIGDENRPLLRDVIYDIAEDIDPFFNRPPPPRPPGIPSAKPAQREYESRSGNQVSRTPEELQVYRDDVGGVEGYMGPDPQISLSSIDKSARGQGIGSSMYRDWAQEAGVPFRSDSQVSRDAAKIYEGMFPKYGYNVLKNPEAQFVEGAGLGLKGAWEVPAGARYEHIYRVEPPGIKSTEFYTNPLAGALPMMWRDDE